ncbi:uncharacterized protein DMENIID0001_143950 [Sergentomyia squamirostris]
MVRTGGIPHHNEVEADPRTPVAQPSGDMQELKEMMKQLMSQMSSISYCKIPKYKLYCANHPSGRGHGGAAVLVRDTIKHFEFNKYVKDKIQAVSVCIDTFAGELIVSAAYCPPRHNNKYDDYSAFFESLGPRFICGGDFNAKHTNWGSRLITAKGRELFKVVNEKQLLTHTTGEPTYWPTDIAKIPDVIDIFVSRGVDRRCCKVSSSLDLSSDHTPILLALHSSVQKIVRPPRICGARTDWGLFRSRLDEGTELRVSLKSPSEIENAVEDFTAKICDAACAATPSTLKQMYTAPLPVCVRDKIQEKRKLRKIWQKTKSPIDKTKFNKSTEELKTLLNDLRNDSLQEYVSGLSPWRDTDYNLWKATKYLKRPQSNVPPLLRQDGTWARSAKEKAEGFADHLSTVFQPWEATHDNDVSSLLEDSLTTPFQMELPVKKITSAEIIDAIMEIRPHKSPGLDLITGTIVLNYRYCSQSVILNPCRQCAHSRALKNLQRGEVNILNGINTSQTRAIHSFPQTSHLGKT